MKPNSLHSRMRLRARSVARALLLAALTVVFAAACGSDGYDVVDTASDATPVPNEVTTNDDESDPVATTAPVDPDTTGDADAEQPAVAALEITGATSGQTVDAEASLAESEPAEQAVESGSLSRSFAANDTTCQSASYGPATGPDAILAANECLLNEFNAGRAVVVDYRLLSTEGNAIYSRYAYDGSQVLVVNDSRLDQFGAQRVIAQLCESIEPGPLVPTPQRCTDTTSAGFADADR